MVEILLASYNGETYIEEQLDSLLRQEYSDFRILIRDDGSTDHTVDKIRAYVRRYPDRIEFIEDEKACGNPTANFMELISHATADYVMFSDQDDVWLPQKVKVTVAAMQETEAACGQKTPILVFSDYEVVDGNLQPMQVRDDQLQIAKFHTACNRLLVQNYVTGCTMMLNRACYRALGTYDSRIQMHDWWAALYCSACGRIVHIPQKLMKYRQHGNNVVSAMNVKSFSYRWQKLFDSRTRSNWKLGVAQARLFLERYRDTLPSETRSVIQNFVDINRHKKVIRMYLLVRGNYLKSDFVRVVGQLFFI